MRSLFRCAAVIVLALVLGQASRANVEIHSKVDLNNVPVRLSFEDGFEKAEINKPTSVAVTVRNSHGQIVAAMKDEKIKLHYQGNTTEGTIPAGKQSVSFSVTPRSAGAEKIEATATGLESAAGFILCIDSNNKRVLHTELLQGGEKHPLARGILRRRIGVLNQDQAQAGPSAPGGTSGAGGSGAAPAAPEESATLKLFITPDPVDPEPDGLWKAQVALALVGKDNQLIVTDRDLPLHLLTQKGKVDPADVVMKKDEASTFSTPVTLTSSQPGADTIAVLSRLPGIQQPITYQAPEAAGVNLEVSPSSVINDGKSPVRVIVMLVGPNETPVNASANTEVVLQSSLGSINPLKVSIAAGECCAEATLTSLRNGSATISAASVGLQAGQVNAMFLFPWMMVSMAAFGGVLGALVHGRKITFSAQWLKAVLPSIVLGIICGVIFCVAALFGAIGSLPKLGLPVQIAQIPSGNELGALLLGFIGGFYGKKIWTKGADDSGEPKKATAQPAG